MVVEKVRICDCCKDEKAEENHYRIISYFFNQHIDLCTDCREMLCRRIKELRKQKYDEWFGEKK